MQTATAQDGTSVLLIGGTGYVGEYMRETMRRAGLTVRLLLRSDREHSTLAARGFQTVIGDVLDVPSLVRAMDGVDSVVNLVGIIKEKGDVTFEKLNYQSAVHVVDAALQAGVCRIVEMSAIGAGNVPEYPYMFTNWRAENYVKDSGLDWTIFRPSIIFGPSESYQVHFISQLADVVRKAPIIPVVGDGTSKFQPIHLEDVSNAFVHAVQDPAAISQTYEIAGPDVLTYEQILDEVAEALGKHKRKLHMPVGLMKIGMSVIDTLPGPDPPVTVEQLKMLSLENVTSNNAVTALTGRPPLPVHGNLGYIREW
jgi:NADH dehydrogenase